MIRSSDQVVDIAEFGLQLAGIFTSRSAINAQLLEGATFAPPTSRSTASTCSTSARCRCS